MTMTTTMMTRMMNEWTPKTTPNARRRTRVGGRTKATEKTEDASNANAKAKAKANAKTNANRRELDLEEEERNRARRTTMWNAESSGAYGAAAERYGGEGFDANARGGGRTRGGRRTNGRSTQLAGRKGKKGANEMESESSEALKGNNFYRELNAEVSKFEDCDELMDFAATNVLAMNVVNLSTTLHRIGKLNSMRGRRTKVVIVEDERYAAVLTRSRELLKLSESGEHPAGIFGVRELASMLWGMAHAGVTTNSGDQTLGLVIKRLARFKDKNLNAQNVSNSLWAYATMHNSAKVNQEFMSAMEAWCEEVMDEFAPQGISNSLWAFATTGYTLKADTMRAFSRAISRNIKEFKSMEFSNVIWALATMRVECDITAIVDETLDEIHSNILAFPNMWSAQSVSNILWAMATLAGSGHQMRPRHDELLRTLVMYVERKTSSFIAQGLANTLWGFATLNYTPSLRMLEVVTERWLTYVNDMSAGECSNLLWSYGNLRFDPGIDVLKSVSELLLRTKREDMNLTIISNTLWAFANFDYLPRNEVMEHMLKVSKFYFDQNEEAITTQSLSNIGWSLANLSYIPDDDVMQSIAARALTEVKKDAFTEQGLSNMVWSWATLGVDPGAEVMREFSNAIAKRLAAFTSQGLSNSLWAFSVLEHWPESWVVDKFRTRILEMDGKMNYKIDLTQLFIADLTFSHFTEFGALITSPTMRESAERAWTELSCSKVIISSMHREVSESLNEMGVPHQIEFVTNDGLFSLDIVLKGRQVAIEVDGPSHFARNKPQRRLGSDYLRRRYLESRGWTVVNVLWYEWAEQSKLNRRTGYLANLLYSQAGLSLMEVSPKDEDLSNSGIEGLMSRSEGEGSENVTTRREGTRLIIENSGSKSTSALPSVEADFAPAVKPMVELGAPRVRSRDYRDYRDVVGEPIGVPTPPQTPPLSPVPLTPSSSSLSTSSKLSASGYGMMTDAPSSRSASAAAPPRRARAAPSSSLPSSSTVARRVARPRVAQPPSTSVSSNDDQAPLTSVRVVRPRRPPPPPSTTDAMS